MAFWRANVVQPLKVHLDNVKIPVEYNKISCACRSPAAILTLPGFEMAGSVLIAG
jgi:hypothetical protein